MRLQRRDFAAIVVMAAAYAVSGRLGLLLAVPPGYATAVWPASGIALASVLAYGMRVWPGIWIGSFLVNVWTALDGSVSGMFSSLAIPVTIATGATLQSLAGASLVHRFVGYRNVLTQEFDVARLLLLGGPAACLINASLSVAALVHFGSVPLAASAFNWFTWWVGDSIGVMVFTPVVLVWTVRPYSQWLRQQLSVSVPMVLMFALVVSIFMITSSRERAQARTSFENVSEEVDKHLQSEIDRYNVGLSAVAGLFAAQREVTPQEFDPFAGLLLSQLPGLYGVSWRPEISGAERDRFEARMHEQGFPAFRITEIGPDGLVPAARRDRYVVTAYSKYQEDRLETQGLDALSSPPRRAAIELARETHQPAATSLLALAGEPAGTPGFLAFKPVFERGGGSLRGYATVVVVLNRMIDQTLRGLPLDGINLKIIDESAHNPELLYARTPVPADASDDDLRYRAIVNVAQRTWTVETTMPAAYLVSHRSWQAWMVLATGLTLTALLGVLLLVIVGRTARVEQVVAERTAELTERKEQLRRARDEALDAARAKSEFVANMSHEIRTPMNGIIGMTQALADTPLTPRQKEIAGAIRFSADSLLSIVNDILDFSKMEAGMMHMEVIDIDLQRAIERVIEVFTERIQGKGLEVVVSLDPKLPHVLRGDPIRLNQVLTNLVSNAIKFTEHGEIEISARLEEDAERDVVVRFAIRDTGIGIPADAARRLFQPFSQADGSTTRKYGGTGLGLVISKQLVELMGGNIGVNSAPGFGSTFWFTVRLQKAPGAEVAQPPRTLVGHRALVVDDNETSRHSIAEQLASWGIAAAQAADGEAALAQHADVVARGEPYEIVIIDQQMPGMDGVELARRIRASAGGERPHLLLLQSVRGSNEPATLRAAGIEMLLTKPVGMSDLHDSLTRLIAGEPVQGATATAAPSAPPPASVEAGQPRVLVAEDNPINQMVARHQLVRLGIQADFVGNGREAVEAVKHKPYDLVLMDCQMPELDGYGATAQIRRHEEGSRHTWIVAMTAHAMAGDRERCLAAGMDDYLAKPIDPKALAAAFERFQHHGGTVTHPDPEPAAPAPAITTPPVDMARLWDAANDDPEFVRELADLYLEQTTEQLKLLKDAVAQRNAAEIERLAHRCKGGSGSCGVNGLAAMFLQLEKMGRDGKLDEVDRIFAGVEREYARVSDFLKQPIARPAAVQQQ
ncbi:MAG TPA: response regulator [Nevskiaceae bacterium]|nr:response regulator [Nevskiaceae bacterium]